MMSLKHYGPKSNSHMPLKTVYQLLWHLQCQKLRLPSTIFVQSLVSEVNVIEIYGGKLSLDEPPQSPEQLSSLNTSQQQLQATGMYWWQASIWDGHVSDRRIQVKQKIRMHWLYAGPSCKICQFWLFAGQCKSIAYQWKILYIFGSKVAICVGDEIDYYQSKYIQEYS